MSLKNAVLNSTVIFTVKFLVHQCQSIFADLVLEILEDEVIKRLGFRLLFCWRYVVDILTAVPADKIDEIKSVFNSYNRHI